MTAHTETEARMIDVRGAVRKAFEHLDILYPDQELKNKLLEEVEYDETLEQWKVVIGFDTDRDIVRSEGPNLFPTKVQEKERKYKQIILDKNGSFIKMKDRS